MGQAKRHGEFMSHTCLLSIPLAPRYQLPAVSDKTHMQIFTQAITPAGTLLAQMPSAREIHTLKPFDVPVLDSLTLNTMRAPPDRSDNYGDENSSDEETVVASRQAPGAYPGSVSSYY
jgi:hypothetical protein